MGVLTAQAQLAVIVFPLRIIGQKAIALLAVHAEAERFFSSAELETHLKPDEILAAVSTLLNLSTR